MKAVNLFDYLSANEYPGRGIAIGRTPCGKKMRRNDRTAQLTVSAEKASIRRN
jgi:hypothetical protein